jgi:RNA polymerase sigma factor (sigma-70 family)
MLVLLSLLAPYFARVGMTMKEFTDQEWIRRLKQDDPEALYALWEMLFTCAHNLARRRRLGDDVGRDAATAAYKRIRSRGVYQFRFECPFRGYCRRIVSNEMNRLSRKRPPPTVELNEEIVGEQDVPSPPANPKKVRALLQQYLDQLAPRNRQVIELLYYKGQSPGLVAERLGISRNHVNVISHRVRVELRKYLEDRGYHSSTDILH